MTITIPGLQGEISLTPEQIALNPDFKITLERLLSLLEVDSDFDEEEDDEVSIPSEYASKNSIKLLTQLYKNLGELFPRGFCSLEGRGGINLIWKHQIKDKEVRVKIPVNSEFSSSLYCRENDNSHLLKNPSFSDIYNSLISLKTK